MRLLTRGIQLETNVTQPIRAQVGVPPHAHGDGDSDPSEQQDSCATVPPGLEAVLQGEFAVLLDIRVHNAQAFHEEDWCTMFGSVSPYVYTTAELGAR